MTTAALALFAPAAEPDWELPEEYTRDNGFRGDTILNGFWLADGKPERIPALPVKGKGVRTFRREFKLPEAWRNRQLFLEINYAKGELRIDGIPAGTLDGKEFCELPITPRTDGPATIEITAPSIEGDVILRSRPQGVHIADSYLRTSFRKMSVTLDVELSAPTGGTVETVISSKPDGSEPALTFTLPIPASGRGSITVPWKDPQLWSRHNPRLYYYTLTLRDPKGNIIDRRLPRSFGFREVWVENGSFMVNGIPTAICDDAWEGSAGMRNICIPQAERLFAKLKEAGISGGIRCNNENAIRMADKHGLHLLQNCGSFIRVNIWDPKSGLTPMNGEESREDVIRRVKRLREHPSILAWSSNTAYALASMHPEYAGQYYNSREYFPLSRSSAEAKTAQELFRELAELVRTVDPERPIASHNGPYSSIETATRYLCDNLDVQEREEFFDFWSRSGKKRKAIWLTEFGIPFAGHQYIRYIDHQMPHGGIWPKIHLENAARYYGPSIYREENEADFERYPRDNYYRHMLYPVMQRLTADNVRRIWRAWRTYGVSASAHHILNEGCFGPLANPSPQHRFGFRELDDPRCPGFSVAMRGTFPMPGIDPETPAARACLDATAFATGYIGGPDGRFTSKDHLFYSGALIRKNFIVINDLDRPVEVEGRWELRRRGTTVRKGDLRGSVDAGMREKLRFIMKFPAPEVSERTDFELIADVSIDGRKVSDRFMLTVFPPHRVPERNFAGKTIWYANISDDLTHETPHLVINRDNAELLKAAGLDARLLGGLKSYSWRGLGPDAAMALHRTRKEVSGTPRPGDLLIIPARTLTVSPAGYQHLLRLLEKIKLDDLVADGVNLLVMEQDLDNLFGMTTEETRPRQAFIAAEGHPAFKGLKDSDLSNWSGESRLRPAITPMGPGEERFPERLWHVSNTNAVATRTLVRPQRGAVRALAASGFDLQESPLLEVAHGRGRMIFCQFDISGRYESDPAATRLFDNLIDYLLSAPAPDPTRSELAAAPRESLEKRSRLFHADRPEGSEKWGITNGELFNREAIYPDNRPVKSLPDTRFPVFSGNGAEIIRRQPGGTLLMCAWTPDDFATGWMKRKVAWIRAALLVNQNGSRTDGPSLSRQGNPTNLYPFVWIKGFVHPYTTDIW